MSVTSIVKSISDRVLELNPEFKKLSHAFTFTSNNFSSSQKRFSVLPARVTEMTTVTRAVTFKQIFQVFLTQGYKVEHLNDDKIIEAICSLQDFGTDIVLRGSEDRFNNANIINIENARLTEAQIEHDYNIVIQTVELTIMYRKFL